MELSTQSGVSVIVCCHNSAKRLPKTLVQLAAQQVLSSVSWEIIIVNNASIDETEEIATSVWQQCECAVPFRIVRENNAGLLYAKAKGMQEAQYEYILYVDDDNWLASNYVQLAFETISAHPEIGMLGGQSEAVCEILPPYWFEQFAPVYAVGKQGQETGPLPKDSGYIYGAGCIIRKSAWEQLQQNGFITLSVGRQGKILSSGEDLELGNALRLAGYILWYEEKLKFQHFIPKERLTWSYLMRLGEGSANSALSSIIYYFIFRYPNLSEKRFRYLYYKRIVWLLWQIVRKPHLLVTAIFQEHNEYFMDNFETWRMLYNLRMSINRRREAVKGFRQVTILKMNLEKINQLV